MAFFWEKGQESGGGGGEVFLHPDVWGPHYWFFLHTVAFTYPDFPSATTKRKYYDLVSNVPLFIPVEAMGADFARLLDEYPVTPYLVNRESFMRWVNFIHNRYNSFQTDKPPVPFFQSVDMYLANYAQPVVKAHFDRSYAARVLYFFFIFGLALLLLFLLIH